ncbi:glycosyltransferase family 2 protein [Butyrivibrio fibrisolvens]|uniref:glycosyltransferase family 2 protein n=1 Tax=Butyrivibrio fibrisolvens TaxID=831 RepID=UPI000421259E|nr:glycosyltransferase [Butyrivibrio fibrisolvens]
MNSIVISLSIIIPVYNGQYTIRKCIDSILPQISSDTEIIIVNDGSTDRSGDICSSICEQDNRVKLINKNNGGVSSARNAGIEVASGKYIMFIDCDDIVPELYFDSFLQMMSQTDDEVFVLSRIATHYESDGRVVLEGSNLISDTYLSRDKLVDIWDDHLWNAPYNKIYIRQLLIDDNIRFDENVRMGEDWLFNNAYARTLRPKAFYIVGNVVYDYYLDSDPWRHCKKEEFYEINKRQINDFKTTLVALDISSKEIDKFDKRDLDFTISEIRRVARDNKRSKSERLRSISALIEKENLKKRIVRHSKLYSSLDKTEFITGNSIIVLLWENIRKKIGIIRNGGNVN